jgi:hypothetical protein
MDIDDAHSTLFQMDKANADGWVWAYSAKVADVLSGWLASKDSDEEACA